MFMLVFPAAAPAAVVVRIARMVYVAFVRGT